MQIPLDDIPVTDQERNEAITLYCAAARDFNANSTEENLSILRMARDHAVELGVLAMAEAAYKAGEWSGPNLRVN